MTERKWQIERKAQMTKEGHNHPHLNPLPLGERRLYVLLLKDWQ